MRALRRFRWVSAVLIVAGLAPADSVVRAGVRVITAPLAAQRNARVLQRNLADLTQDAYTIVAGRVTSVRSEAHPQFANIHTVVVTLSVSEVWKGHAYGDFSFRMFVDDPLDQQTDLGYKPGQEVLLFLTKPSQYGLSSPAGLEQGRFLITKDAQGNRFARNGVNNFGLFAKIDQKAPTLKSRLTPQARQVASDQTKGPITYDQLKEIVLALLAGSR